MRAPYHRGVTGPTSTVSLGLVVSALATALPAATIWLLLHADQIGVRAVRLARRWHLLKPERVVTYEPPIERIAADLRRLATERRGLGRGTSAVRWRGLTMAYDQTLVTACRSLGIRTALAELPDGMDRELERLRVEAALEQAGLRFLLPLR